MDLRWAVVCSEPRATEFHTVQSLAVAAEVVQQLLRRVGAALT